MMNKFPVFILTVALLLSSCTRPTHSAHPYTDGLTAVQENNPREALRCFSLAIVADDHAVDAHLQLGSLCAGNAEQLPLAIWHFSQVEKLTDNESQRINAQLRRESAEKKYLQALQEAWATTEALDAKLQIQLLKEQNNKLNEQLNRISRENATLRQMASGKE